MAGNFELTGGSSRLGVNTGGVMDTTFEVGGTASVSGTLTLSGFLTSLNIGSNSFAGSLNLSKGLAANSYQGAGLIVCDGGNQKLLYSAGQFSCGVDSVGGGGALIGTKEKYLKSKLQQYIKGLRDGGR